MKYNYVVFEREESPPLNVISKVQKLPIIHEVLSILGRTYEAEIVLQESPGCERVYSLHLSENGETLGFYEDGRWIIELDSMDGEPFIAVSYFMNAYNKSIKGDIYEQRRKKRL